MMTTRPLVRGRIHLGIQGLQSLGTAYTIKQHRQEMSQYFNKNKNKNFLLEFFGSDFLI